MTFVYKWNGSGGDHATQLRSLLVLSIVFYLQNDVLGIKRRALLSHCQHDMVLCAPEEIHLGTQTHWAGNLEISCYFKINCVAASVCKGTDRAALLSGDRQNYRSSHTVVLLRGECALEVHSERPHSRSE